MLCRAKTIQLEKKAIQIIYRIVLSDYKTFETYLEPSQTSKSEFVLERKSMAKRR